MEIYEQARRAGKNCDGVPMGLINWMVSNRQDTHEEYLVMCPITRDVHDVVMSYDTPMGMIHLTTESGEC